MASTDARPVPRKNAAYRVTFPLLDADGDPVTGATGLDSEISKDGAAFADCTNEATEITAAAGGVSGVYYLDLTSTEMNADTVAIVVRTSTSGAKTTVLVMYPEEIGDYRADVQMWLGTAPTTPGTAGVPNVDIARVANAAVSTASAQLGVNVVTYASGQAPLQSTVAGRTLDVTTTGEAGIDWANIGAPTTSQTLSGTTVGTASAVTGLTASNLDTTISSRLAPTVAGRTLDVSTGGEAGVDWANVGTPGSTVALSSTTVGTVTTTGTATNVTTVNGLAANVITAAAINTGAITNTKFAAGAIDAAAIAADAIGASELAADAVTEMRSLASGTSDSGTTTTMVDAARTEADTDYWKGQVIVFTSGTISGQARLITGFNAATDTITFAPATTQAVSTQTYEIWPWGRVDIGQISGADVSATTAQLGVNVVNAAGTAWNSGSIGASTLAADTLTAAKVAADVTTEITSGLATSANVTSAQNTITALLPSALVSGRMDASVGAMAANTMTASALATDAVTEIVNAIFAVAGADPAGVPAANAAWPAKIDWICAKLRNKETMNRTTGVVALRNDGDTTTIGTFTATDDGTTFTRPKAT